MNDPDSYQHIRTNYADHGDKITVVMEYRAKNAFGGYVPASIVADASLDGEVLEILNASP